MRITHICFLVLFTIPASLYGQMAPSANPASADPSVLMTLDNKIDTALAGSDVRYLEQAFAPGLRYRVWGGNTLDKAATLKRFAAPGLFISRTVDAVEVEEHDGTAITTGHIHAKRQDGSEYTVFYVRVYGKNDGDWRLLSHRTVYEIEENYTHPVR